MDNFFLENEPARIFIPFIEDDDYFVPTIGSVTYTLRDHNNQPMTGQINIPVTTTSTTTAVSIDIAAGYHYKNPNKDFENRTLEVRGTQGVKPFLFRVHYGIMEAIPIPLEPENVRRFLGCSASELPDYDIDVYSSYLSSCEKFGKENFKELLLLGNRKALAAEATIYLITALVCLPSLKLRVSQTETDGVVRFSRFTNMNWEALEESLQAQLATELIETGLVGASDTFFGGVLGAGTDKFPE